MTRCYCAYISHGAGPLPLLGDKKHQEMISVLEQVTKALPKPDAIIVVSAHWEAADFSLTANVQPELLYDYYGFPEAAYQLQYPAPGIPALAKDINEALLNAGMKSGMNYERGFDHGLYVPLSIMYPEADVPCIQVSLNQAADPKAHITLGKTLKAVAERSGIENLLLLGSGFSFHNMKAFFHPHDEQANKANRAFEAWLTETMTNTDIDERERAGRLSNWQQAPGGTFCHPTPEHLLPLHVCYGFMQRIADTHYEAKIFAKDASFFVWQ